MSDNLTSQDVAEAMQASVGSRHVAAEVLQKVAEMGQYGSFPDDVTCEQLGRALERICLNSPENDAMLAVFRGWRDAEVERIERRLYTARA